jgi:hypothetical protein
MHSVSPGSKLSATRPAAGRAQGSDSCGNISETVGPFDFDGDDKTDVSIFRPGPGEWRYLRSSDGGNNAFSEPVRTFPLRGNMTATADRMRQFLDNQILVSKYLDVRNPGYRDSVLELRCSRPGRLYSFVVLKS